MRYHAVLFDLDGTLVDSQPGIESSMRWAFDELNFPQPDDAAMRSLLGPPLYTSFRHILGMAEEQTHRAIQLYRQRYSEKGLYECSLYPGMMEVLQGILARGGQAAIATAKPIVFATEVAKHMGIFEMLTALEGPEMDARETDKTEIVRAAMQKTKGPHLMVGDRRYDLLAARQCGIDSAAALYGYASPGEIQACAPTYAARDAKELAAILFGGE